jgi:hypothetical protein
MLRNFGNTHKVIPKPEFSGTLIINKKVVEEFPEIIDYGIKVLQSHI